MGAPDRRGGGCGIDAATLMVTILAGLITLAVRRG